MNTIPTDIEQMDLDAARRWAEVAIQALSLCCDERNKLSQDQKTPSYFLYEAIQKS